MQALLLSHPRRFIRDTARYPPLMRATAPGRRPKPRALRHLALEHLGLTIQVRPEGGPSVGPEDSTTDAHQEDWQMPAIARVSNKSTVVVDALVTVLRWQR